MTISHILSALRATILLAPFLTAACGGGGGVSPAAPATSIATTTTAAASNNQSTYCCSNLGSSASLGWAYSTGLPAGPIAAAPPATFGTASPQIAVFTGQTFDGTTNVTFPLVSTGLQAASPGLGALAASPGATATVTSSPSNYTLQLVIPSANINATLSGSVSAAFPIPGEDPTWGLSYVVLGGWGNPSSGPPLQNEEVFAFGYETPPTAMPKTGTASFTGYADASVFKSVGANILTTYLDGNAAVTANFASGQVTGALTHMLQWDGNSYGGSNNIPINYLPWNDVSITASIASGTNRFSGSTAATSAPGTTFSLSASATGHVDGAFYGPAAQNLGAVWSLSDGTVSAIGTIGAKQ